MSHQIFTVVLLGSLATGALRADDVLPKAPPASKYARMAAHSPFAPPTAQVAPQAKPTPPPAPGWADNLTATMIMRDGNKFMVTVIDGQNSQHLYLTSEPDRLTQMAVASVKWGANRDDPPTVTLSKGKEVAQVKFESGAASPGGNNQLGGAPNPGMGRNPQTGGPAIPGAQPFHPPSFPNNGQGGNQAGSSVLRRPLIHSPATLPAAGGARPGVGQPNALSRPNPGVKVDDDDDDD